MNTQASDDWLLARVKLDEELGTVTDSFDGHIVWVRTDGGKTYAVKTHLLQRVHTTSAGGTDIAKNGQSG